MAMPLTGLFVVVVNYLLIFGLLVNSVAEESTCTSADSGSIPRLGTSTGGGTGYPLQD